MATYIRKYRDDTGPFVRETNIGIIKKYLKDGSAILDIGAGNCTLSKILMSEGFSVTAVDIKERNNHDPKKIKYVRADLNQGIPFVNTAFDAVIAEDVLEHLENPWFIFREVSRVLKNKGIFLMSTPNLSHLFAKLYELLFNRNPYFSEQRYRFGGHLTPLSFYNINRMAERAGLETVQITYNMNYLPVLRIKLPFRTSAFGHTLILAFRKKPL